MEMLKISHYFRDFFGGRSIMGLLIRAEAQPKERQNKMTNPMDERELAGTHEEVPEPHARLFKSVYVDSEFSPEFTETLHKFVNQTIIEHPEWNVDVDGDWDVDEG